MWFRKKPALSPMLVVAIRHDVAECLSHGGVHVEELIGALQNVSKNLATTIHRLQPAWGHTDLAGAIACWTCSNVPTDFLQNLGRGIERVRNGILSSLAEGKFPQMQFGVGMDVGQTLIGEDSARGSAVTGADNLARLDCANGSIVISREAALKLNLEGSSFNEVAVPGAPAEARYITVVGLTEYS